MQTTNNEFKFVQPIQSPQHILFPYIMQIANSDNLFLLQPKRNNFEMR